MVVNRQYQVYWFQNVYLAVCLKVINVDDTGTSYVHSISWVNENKSFFFCFDVCWQFLEQDNIVTASSTGTVFVYKYDQGSQVINLEFFLVFMRFWVVMYETALFRYCDWFGCFCHHINFILHLEGVATPQTEDCLDWYANHFLNRQIKSTLFKVCNWLSWTKYKSVGSSS